MLSPTCPLLLAGPLGCWHNEQRWGHGHVLASLSLPITSGALNSCHSPGCLSQGPPGCWVTAPAPMGPHHQPWPRGTCGTPGLEASCAHGARLRAGSVGASLQWRPSPGSCPIPRARSLRSAVGMRMLLSSPGKRPSLAPKMGSVVYSSVELPRPHWHMGINNLDLFPWGCSKA